MTANVGSEPHRAPLLILLTELSAPSEMQSASVGPKNSQPREDLWASDRS